MINDHGGLLGFMEVGVVIKKSKLDFMLRMNNW